MYQRLQGRDQSASRALDDDAAIGRAIVPERLPIGQHDDRFSAVAIRDPAAANVLHSTLAGRSDLADFGISPSTTDSLR